MERWMRAVHDVLETTFGFFVESVIRQCLKRLGELRGRVLAILDSKQPIPDLYDNFHQFSQVCDWGPHPAFYEFFQVLVFLDLCEI